MQQLRRFKSISSFHQFRGLPNPEHPLFSIVDVSGVKHLSKDEPKSLVFDFYSIGFKKVENGKMKYGQQYFDFEDGVMGFTAPGQVFGIEVNEGDTLNQTGYVLLIHPDFLWNTPLAAKIKQYDFFDYTVNESLFLSAKEEAIMAGIIQNMQTEYHSNIDKLSHDIIISQLETLLAYSERFYQRQFITRKKVNHQLLSGMEELLNTWFADGAINRQGLPSVKYIADKLNVSPGYLSGVLRSLTGQNTQQHIHAKLIDKAKQMLTTTNQTVSQIAYGLGFEHIQSFSKLFKTKTQLSPGEFRALFN